jgi:hypothetical protein
MFCVRSFIVKSSIEVTGIYRLNRLTFVVVDKPLLESSNWSQVNLKIIRVVRLVAGSRPFDPGNNHSRESSRPGSGLGLLRSIEMREASISEHPAASGPGTGQHPLRESGFGNLPSQGM